MKQQFTIPSKITEFNTDDIQLHLQTKKATIFVSIKDSGSLEKAFSVTKTVDVVNAFSGSMSGPEVTAFKKGLKLIIADGWGQTFEDLSGDVF